jgi:hypothetical protein
LSGTALNSPLFEDVKGVKNILADPEALMIQRYWIRFNRAETEAKKKHDKWATLDTFDRGEQWKDVAMPPWIPKPVTNYIRYVRTMKRANLASAIPKASFYPVSPDDTQVITQLQKAYNHVWEESKMPRVVRRCIDRATLQGTSIAYTYFDDSYVGGKYYGKDDSRNNLYEGKICVKRFPNAQFFPDPDAYRVEECKYIETTELVPLSKIKNTGAFKKYAGKKLDEYKGNQVETDSNANGEIYNRDSYPSQSAFGNQVGEELVTLHTHYERYLNENGKWQLDVTYYIRNSSFALLRLVDVQPNVYPFAVYYDEEEENDFWGTSTAMDILDNQKILNKLSQTSSIISTLHQNPQKVVQRDSGINAQELARTGTLAGKVWQSNIPNPIEIIQHPDIPNGLFETEDRLKQDIEKMVGLNEAYTGQSVGSLTTSTGVDSLIERATVRDKDKTLQIDDFIEDLSHIIVLFIINHWKEERPISSSLPNGDVQHDQYKPIDKLTAENLEWRIRSDVYAKSPMTQASKRQQADKLMQMQGQFQFNPPIITPEEWIQFQDFDMKEQILSRMEQDRAKLQQQDMQNMTQQIMAIMQQSQQMKASGAGDQEVQQQMTAQVQQLLQQTQSTGASQSTDGSGQPSAPAESQAPQGSTSQASMMNMANGS